MPCLDRPKRLLAASLLAGAAGVACAQANAPAGSEAELVSRAQAWLSGRYQVQPSTIGVQAMDPRVQARGCEGGWQFDQPFAGNEGMLRARCPQNNWQVFLKVMLPPRAVMPAAGPAPSAAPGLAGVATPSGPAPILVPAGLVQTAQATPHLVKRGQTVLATWAPVSGLMVSARLEALDDGRMGETIRLKNRDTGRIVSAVVNGQNTAQGL
jgi:hypothetical protein